ncbi:transposable element Tcb2 transposase [Trichonephila clavipes]|nr:transposable element Tcb2 transposase [Trichonephila clavipes]
MVWSGIFISRHIELHIIRKGNLPAQKYANEMLRSHVELYSATVGDLFLLMRYNGRPYTAFTVENLIEAETIQRMERPACSSDINPIKHVWYTLGRCLTARPRPHVTVQDL